MTSSKVFVDSENGKNADDYFLLEHDSQYVTGLSFHIVVSWIFASGPKMLEGIMKPLFRLIRENCNGYFKVLPISEKIRNVNEVPFENQITLRKSVDTECHFEETRKISEDSGSISLKDNLVDEKVSNNPDLLALSQNLESMSSTNA